MKKRGFKLFALAVITACCFGISAASAFAADGESKTAMNGASIRTAEPTGLRFEALVDETTYDSVIADGNKSFGAFILPKDYLDKANITSITNHKEQFTAVEKYLEKEEIEGEKKTSDYVLKYSIADLHYYNYNRDFVGTFFIKTVGADNAATYEYFTTNEGNNVRSVAYVAKAAIENGTEEETAIYFAIAAKYLEANPYDSAKEEATQKSEAEAYVFANKANFKTAYAAIKAAAEIETINILDADQKTTIEAARTAYDGADTVIKQLLADFGSYAKFVANEKAFKEAESAGLIETVNNAIAALPEYNVSAVPVVYNKAYKTAKAAYDALTSEQKEEVTDYAKLQKYEAVAAKAKLIYEDGVYSLNSNTTANAAFIKSVESIPDKIKDFGNITRVWCNGAGENVRLAFNNIGDLSEYDVVRFPIYFDSDQISTSSYYLIYKYKGDASYAVQYGKALKSGWNFVTVPVSKVADGMEIGANAIGAGVNIYYAIPYAEKLESGDAIASYKYENDRVYTGGAIDSFTDSYRAEVTIATAQDNDYGTVMNVKAELGSWSNDCKYHYAFKYNNLTELKSVITEIGATSVKFKIKANKESSLYMTASSGNVTTISLNTTWSEVELTAEEFANWNGYFRKDWAAPIELQLTDFVIVK